MSFSTIDMIILQQKNNPVLQDLHFWSWYLSFVHLNNFAGGVNPTSSIQVAGWMNEMGKQAMCSLFIFGAFLPNLNVCYIALKKH